MRMVHLKSSTHLVLSELTAAVAMKQTCVGSLAYGWKICTSSMYEKNQVNRDLFAVITQMREMPHAE